MQGQPQNPLEDQELTPYHEFLRARGQRFQQELTRIQQIAGSLTNYANLHLDLGLHLHTKDGAEPYWLWREYLPGAKTVWLTTERLHFQRHAKFRFTPKDGDIFELRIPYADLCHGLYVELRIEPKNYEVLNADGIPTTLKRVPAFATWVEQNREIPTLWCARIFHPQSPYQFTAPRPTPPQFLRIYEAHVGMAQPDTKHQGESVGTYADFSHEILPRIKACGYTSVQLMAIPEHPLYRSFGYQVSSYFAPCSRFGSPDDLKELIDHAHTLGLQIILDITHAHSCSNTEQGLSNYDGTSYFFSAQTNQWGTPTFDFNLEMTRKFLLSNLRYWLEEYRVDGFRFDAVERIVLLMAADHDKQDQQGNSHEGERSGRPDRADHIPQVCWHIGCTGRSDVPQHAT